MPLRKKFIEDFKKAYFEEFGKGLTDKEAAEKAERLISLLRVICRPAINHDDQSSQKQEGSGQLKLL